LLRRMVQICAQLNPPVCQRQCSQLRALHALQRSSP
jgi:hypothetical protein